MIEVEGLGKRFGSRVALRDVSFRADRGEVLGFLGPNGAGKTTTMRILASLTPPTTGRARIAGHDTVREALAARRSIGYLPERVSLYDEMGVREFLAFAGAMKGLGGAERGRAVSRAAEATGTVDVLDVRVGKLSRGYRQRVGIAQALLGDPPVLLLDEPTAGLDPRQNAEIRDLIRRLGGERTILLSTHILPEVTAICSRVLILARGRVVAADTPEALAGRLAAGREVVVRLADPDPAVPPLLASIPGVSDVATDGAGTYRLRAALDDDPRPRVARALVEGGHQLLEMAETERSLEEIFLELVTEEEPR